MTLFWSVKVAFATVVTILDSVPTVKPAVPANVFTTFKSKVPVAVSRESKVTVILLSTVTSPEEIQLVGISIFEIASNNRFYSKLYADLYGQLIHKYEFMNTIVEENFNKFLELFKNIEYVDSTKDYTKFCKINKDNEMRKALGAFFVNLTHNNIISYEKLFGLTYYLLEQLLILI